MTNWTADDGTTINYEVYGSASGKPTLLILPGLLGSISTQWRNFITPLSKDFQIVLMDLRGHGRSENRQPKLELQRMVQDISGLLDSMRIESVHVCGYSLGGYLGLLLHLHQPRRVPTLFMHATKFYWTKDAVANMRKQFDPDMLAKNVPGYADQLAREHGGSRWRALVREASDLVGEMSTKGVTEGQAARVQCPVMVSVGDRDELVPLPEVQRLSRVFPKGELLVLPGVRHPFPSLRLVPMLHMMQQFHLLTYNK